MPFSSLGGLSRISVWTALPARSACTSASAEFAPDGLVDGAALAAVVFAGALVGVTEAATSVDGVAARFAGAPAGAPPLTTVDCALAAPPPDS